MTWFDKDEESQGMTYAVEGGRLVLSIGISCLAHAMRTSPDLEGENGPRLTVKDEKAFAAAIARELEGNEDEAGETSITRALIKAALEVVELADPAVEWAEE